MDAASAPIHALIVALTTPFVALAGGCGAPQSGLPVGMSNAQPEPASSVAPLASQTRWPDFEAARAWPEAAPASVARVHFRDGTLVHVRVEPPGLEAYRKLAADSPMPEEARVVAWHESRAGKLRGGYLLQKRQGVWSAQEIDGAGGLIPGDGSLCLRCHEMSPTDHLFGAPPAAVVPVGGQVPESIQPAAR